MKKTFLAQTLFKRFYDWYRETLRHPKYRWWVVLATLFYLLSPIDLASDALPILGWIDDAAIATVFATEVSQLLLSSLKRNQKQTGRAGSATAPTANATVVDVDAVAVN